MREASEVALITGAVCFAVASNVASSPRVARSAAAGNVGIAWCTGAHERKRGIQDADLFLNNVAAL